MWGILGRGGVHCGGMLGNGGAVVEGMIWLGLPRSLGAATALHLLSGMGVNPCISPMFLGAHGIVMSSVSLGVAVTHFVHQKAVAQPGYGLRA